VKSVQPVLLLLAALICHLAIVPAAQAQSLAAVRLVHAVADAPAITFYANGKPLVDSLEFSNVTDYITLKPGKYQFQIVIAGDDTSTTRSFEATLKAGTFNTVAAVGHRPNVRPAFFVDNLEAPDAGQAVVRVYHLSPDAPAIDLAIKDSTKLVFDLPFPDASTYFTLGADSYHLQVLPATVTWPVLVDLPAAKLEAGKINNIFVLSSLVAITAEVNPSAPQTLRPRILPKTGDGDVPQTLAIILGLLLLTGGMALRLFTLRYRCSEQLVPAPLRNKSSRSSASRYTIH
jgi:hypothetical protein